MSYKIYYNWGVIWMEAGEAIFKVDYELKNRVPAYHFTGIGFTYPKYDWFYKVRDKFESYADTTNIKPIYFARYQNEGSTSVTEKANFNFKQSKANTSINNGKILKTDSVKITPCTIDVITAIYYARCIDFSTHKPNDTIPITLYLENKIYPVYIRYIGKEVFNAEGLGKFNCIKFKPLLIEGTIFKGGEGMTVWVTDDENKIPLYVETPIVIGSVKVRLSKCSGLRNNINSKIK